jgi:hypothetical protein
MIVNKLSGAWRPFFYALLMYFSRTTRRENEKDPNKANCSSASGLAFF